MNDFWNNLIRYPRFLISSTAGLILIILAPLKNLFKVPRLRVFLIITLAIFLCVLYVILEHMLGL